MVSNFLSYNSNELHSICCFFMNCWFLNLEIIIEILETFILLYTTIDFVGTIWDTSAAERDENVLAAPTENLLYLYYHT